MERARRPDGLGSGRPDPRGRPGRPRPLSGRSPPHAATRSAPAPRLAGGALRGRGLLSGRPLSGALPAVGPGGEPGEGGAQALMRWLIDGYNVIRRDPDLRAHETESLEAGRTAPPRPPAPAPPDARDEFTRGFDGARGQGGAPPPGRSPGGFSRPPFTPGDQPMRLARPA